jgi:hypothetical protein
MKLQRVGLVILLANILGGCASVKFGDKDTEARLKSLQPILGKTSLYVCREQAGFVGAGNRTTVIVDGNPIGTLKPNNFAHTVVEPGNHEVYVKHNPGGNSGTLNISTQSGEVAFIWVGMTGHGFGTLTVDNFSSKSDAEECVRNAEYMVRSD